MQIAERVEIHPFRAEDQEAVKRLILAGLVDHWGTLDPSKNPDLNDIAASYAGAVFLVAWHDGCVAGTGALVRRSADVGEIVRMSVAGPLRRHGLGRAILRRLIDQAAALGYRRLILETTETWQEVIAFYQGFGFRHTHTLGKDAYFALELSNKEE